MALDQAIDEGGPEGKFEVFPNAFIDGGDQRCGRPSIKKCEDKVEKTPQERDKDKACYLPGKNPSSAHALTPDSLSEMAASPADLSSYFPSMGIDSGLRGSISSRLDMIQTRLIRLTSCCFQIAAITIHGVMFFIIIKHKLKFSQPF